MNESEIEWANVKALLENIVTNKIKYRFVFDKNQECENYIEIKYSVLRYTTGNEYYYQRIVELP